MSNKTNPGPCSGIYLAQNYKIWIKYFLSDLNKKIFLENYDNED